MSIYQGFLTEQGDKMKDLTKYFSNKYKVKSWNRARKILAMYGGNRIMLKKVHNYYTILAYPNQTGMGATITYFEHWKKTYWEALPKGKLDQKINNIYKHIFNDYEEFLF